MSEHEPYSMGSNYLDVLHEMTEAAQKQARDSVARSQDVVVDAVAAWSRTVQNLIPTSMPTTAADHAPKPAELVDSGFKIAEQLLAAQHQFVQRLLEAVQPIADTAATGAAEAAEAAEEAADEAEKGAVKQTFDRLRGAN